MPKAKPTPAQHAVEPQPLLMLLAALSGGLVLGARPRRDERLRSLATAAGMTLLGLAAAPSILKAVRSSGTRKRSAQVRLSFVVDRHVEQVFAFFADFENFPKFIGALREVHDAGDGRSHWCASTPAGRTIEWNAITTKFVTNTVIGWQSVPGSPVEMTGLVRVSPEGDRTCVRIAIDYSVIDGHLLDALAALVTHRNRDSVERAFLGIERHIPAPTAAQIASEIPAVVAPGSAVPAALSAGDDRVVTN